MKLRARQRFIDKLGIERKAGEEWLYKKAGSYSLEVEEEFVEILNSFTITEKKALHLKAK